MSKEVRVKLNNDTSKEPSAILSRYKDKSLYPDRTKDRGIVNEENGSSIIIKDNGDISMCSQETANIKITQDKVIEVANESTTIANRKILQTDEIIINNQKLNPQLIELSDTKVLFDNPEDAIGNLLMDGTVLVKAWEPTLQKYVLIRRKIRTPLFSHKLNKVTAPEFFDVATDYINDLTADSAKLLRDEKIKKEKATAQEEAAQGGSIYDQGDYNNYLTEFIQSSNSMAQQGGFEGGYTTSGTTTQKDIIAFNTSGLTMVWPVPEYHGAYSSTYGIRYNPDNKFYNPEDKKGVAKGKWHEGVDIPPKPSLQKKTKIAAAAAGKVIAARSAPQYKEYGEPPYTGYGQVVEIDHGNGLKTLYAHLDKVLVTEGQEVAQGQHIGYMGCTGSVYSSSGGDGTHLHFTVWGEWNGRKADRYTGFNPAGFIKPQN